MGEDGARDSENRLDTEHSGTIESKKNAGDSTDTSTTQTSPPVPLPPLVPLSKVSSSSTSVGNGEQGVEDERERPVRRLTLSLSDALRSSSSSHLQISARQENDKGDEDNQVPLPLTRNSQRLKRQDIINSTVARIMSERETVKSPRDPLSVPAQNWSPNGVDVSREDVHSYETEPPPGQAPLYDTSEKKRHPVRITDHILDDLRQRSATDIQYASIFPELPSNHDRAQSHLPTYICWSSESLRIGPSTLWKEEATKSMVLPRQPRSFDLLYRYLACVATIVFATGMLQNLILITSESTLDVSRRCFNVWEEEPVSVRALNYVFYITTALTLCFAGIVFFRYGITKITGYYFVYYYRRNWILGTLAFLTCVLSYHRGVVSVFVSIFLLMIATPLTFSLADICLMYAPGLARSTLLVSKIIYPVVIMVLAVSYVRNYVEWNSCSDTSVALDKFLALELLAGCYFGYIFKVISVLVQKFTNGIIYPVVKFNGRACFDVEATAATPSVLPARMNKDADPGKFGFVKMDRLKSILKRKTQQPSQLQRILSGSMTGDTRELNPGTGTSESGPVSMVTVDDPYLGTLVQEIETAVLAYNLHHGNGSMDSLQHHPVVLARPQVSRLPGTVSAVGSEVGRAVLCLHRSGLEIALVGTPAAQEWMSMAEETVLFPVTLGAGFLNHARALITSGILTVMSLFLYNIVYLAIAVRVDLDGRCFNVGSDPMLARVFNYMYWSGAVVSIAGALLVFWVHKLTTVWRVYLWWYVRRNWMLHSWAMASVILRAPWEKPVATVIFGFVLLLITPCAVTMMECLLFVRSYPSKTREGLRWAFHTFILTVIVSYGRGFIITNGCSQIRPDDPIWIFLFKAMYETAYLSYLVQILTVVGPKFSCLRHPALPFTGALSFSNQVQRDIIS